MYLALDPDDIEIPPFDWYLAHMTVGAREHALPDTYRATLDTWPTRVDDR